MVWTAPSTITAGDDLTASLWNVQVRDNLKAIGDPWTAYTPTWTATGTAPAIGNGTLSGRYMAAGKTIMLSFSFTAGSTTTYGTGSYRWSLPVSAFAHTAPFGLGGHMYAQRGVGYMFFPRFVTATTFELQYHSATTDGGAANVVGQTTPATWASGDVIRGYMFYEAA